MSINDHLLIDGELSGDARELGIEALEIFTTARHVHWNPALRPKPWWFGFD